jgi:CRISPR-associated Cas5-like protein
MTDWIFQGNGKRYDLDAAINASRLQSWRTPRYRDRTSAGDRVWLQVVGRADPGIYYVAAITAATYEDPEWRDGDSASARWRTDVRFDYRIDPPLLRVELLASGELASFRPFRGFQGSTVPVPPPVAAALGKRAAPRLEPLGPDASPQRI